MILIASEIMILIASEMMILIASEIMILIASQMMILIAQVSFSFSCLYQGWTYKDRYGPEKI
jgi:hypothetical protein